MYCREGPRRVKGQEINLSVSHDSAIVHGREIGLEQAPVAFCNWAGLLVLIEKREDEGLEGSVGHQRRSLAGRQVLHELAVEGLSVGHAAGVPTVANGGPPRFSDDDVHVAVAQVLHGGVHRIQQRVELVGVAELGVPVVQAAVGPEEKEVHVLPVVREIGIRVHHEGHSRLLQKLQHRAQHVLCVSWSEPPRARRNRRPHYRQRVSGGHLKNRQKKLLAERNLNA